MDNMNVCEHMIHKLLPCELCKLQKRIDELEKLNIQNSTRHLVDSKSLQILDKRVQELERYKSLIDSIAMNRNDWMEPVNKLINRVDDLENRLKELHDTTIHNNSILSKDIYKIEKQLVKDKKPHKCPICEGDGDIPFIEEMIIKGKLERVATDYNDCTVCDKTGVVWG